jgi:two-component system CheB/CheR fusion protein
MTIPNAFPIVGIGASAGGLQALEHFFRNTPPDTGLAFIVVTHLPRDRESVLCDILQRYTAMSVSVAGDGQVIEANHLYCNPPDHIVTVENRTLRLRPRMSSAQHKPIDVFLGSLAEDCGPAAIGVVLSGSGTDGALGMKGIKERGGFTLAQGSDGTVPQHPDMPEAAIAADVVDLVLSVEEMGARLADYAVRYPQGLDDADEADDAAPAMLSGDDAIYEILLQRVGHDFSGYKQRTFQRRVRRRMQVTQMDELEDYVALLRSDPNEVNHLFRDLLIGVTNFFRDRDAFAILEQEVIPKLFEGKGVNDTVRICVPGCATGEEVYSIGILVREYLEKLRPGPKVQIFATDIDESALGVARAARYPATLMDNVDPERLKRHFTGDDASYAVAKEIRELCVFSPHSVLRDPPFSRMDLISCRNLLIYLGSDFQSQVIPVFHFALRPRGYLFLGTSENVSQHGGLFAPIDKKQRIFQRRDHVVTPLRLPALGHPSRTIPTAADLRREPAGLAANLRRAVDTWVMERFAPAHVVVDREGDILHYSPRTGKYLKPASGMPNRQLLGMARRGLRLDLRSAFREAVEWRRRVERFSISVEFDERVQKIDLTIEPLSQTDSDPLFLVVFRDVGLPVGPIELETQRRQLGTDEGTIDRLEHELRDSRERLQGTIEEYETAVEELKSSNEELQSVNEELQSTNEELETSKEELQSLNEELHTVNSELNAKVDEVGRANADLSNIFESTRIATVFLDQNLVIRTFTPAVTDIFNLISTDRGRPLTDIASTLEDGDLRRDVRAVFERGEIIERRVRRADGKASYLMRILPYRAESNVIEGVIVTFIDVTTLVEAESHLRTLVEELNHRVRNMLAVVAAIARQTLKTTRSPDAFVDAFTSRIRSMADAFTLVSNQNWNRVELHDVIAKQLEPFSVSQADRLKIQGGELLLHPTHALAISLIVHELATNAVKHGALSSPAGSVTVAWTPLGEGQLELAWREDGGPKPGNPTKAGFGTELIEREIHGTLHGSASFNYAGTGLTATILFPLK